MKSDPETAQEPTPWEKFVELARKVVQTPKGEVDKRERAWRAERKKRGESSHIIPWSDRTSKRRKVNMFSQIIKWAALGLVIVSYNISTAAAQCSTSGDELVDRIDFEIIPKAIQVLEAVPDPGRDASMNALATAVTEIGEICTCNIEQSAYVSISLSQISLLRTLTICKYDVPPESLQQCSSAANAGLIRVRNTKSVLRPEVRQASCGAVDPIPPGAIPVVQQEVFDATQRVASSLSRRSPVALRKILRRGTLVTFNPQADGTAQVSLDAIQAIAGGKISVPVANGTAVGVPVEINLRMIRGGNKNLRNQRTKKLRLTITFTMNDGRAFSAVRTFKVKERLQ